MKRDAAFDLAIQWRDNPVLLVGDLRATFDWLWKNSDEATDAVARATGARVMIASLVPEALERLIPLHKALTKYAILLKAAKLTPELLDPVIDSLTLPHAALVSEDSATGSCESSVMVTGLTAVTQAIELTQRWVDKQEQLRSGEGNRSEILKTTIEVGDDELLVKTDQDGSLKLRLIQYSDVPGVLSTAKHHLTIDAFLDIDRTVKPTNLDRHRVRLSSKLHDVMIEIVSEKDGYRMQKFRQH
ncbi:MAG: hypothetical protein WKF77_05460 [Planctomycetaceae bacterium]